MVSVQAWGGRIAAINMLALIPIPLKRLLGLDQAQASRNDCLQNLVSSLNGIIGLWLKFDEERTCVTLNTHVLQKNIRSLLFK